MAIATIADYQAALKQKAYLNKSGLTFALAATWYSWWPAGTVPAAGSAPSNTTTGVVPTASTTGAVAITPFSGAGYVTGIEYMSPSAVRFAIYDRLFHMGAFSLAAGTTTLSTQPSYSSRVPGGTDYSGLEIWIEGASGAGGAVGGLVVTYTDQSGNTGHSTVSDGLGGAAMALGKSFRLALAAGDCGVQTIESVVITGGSATATANVVVARPIWKGRPRALTGPDYQWLDQLGAPQIWQDSCLYMIGMEDSPGLSPSAIAELEIASA